MDAENLAWLMATMGAVQESGAFWLADWGRREIVLAENEMHTA
ncbi:MAG: hypothetical protein R3C03_11885 [Pirellulaceae bacterium]